ncbi:AMP-binding protein [Flexivirga oryzae]|uniref:Fatty-acyl-CoA synthase n=1 Tax=Flexivirga oryzae TaxID=1794944 RepID=A0A839N646_9MICO|nr:fatty-acyl-CoA synthase [Flexivirga oryzae]
MSEDGVLTLGRWLADRGRVTPDRVAIDCPGCRVTYRELDERSARLAERMRAAGIHHGDRVATLSSNNADHVVAFFACARAGFVLVPLCWRLTPAELAYQLDDSGPVLVLTDGSHAPLAEAAVDAAASYPPRVRLGADGIEREVPHVATPANREPVEDTDPLLLIYTSGSTGRPKGALLSHGNCFWTNLSLSRTAGMTGDDVVLAILPQYHVGGWNVQPLLAWWCGATVVMPDGFDAGEALRLIAEKGVTTMMGVPATYQFLAEHADFADTDLSGLRLALVGGAPMPEGLLRTWLDRGVQLTQGYGLTEAAPNVLCLPPEDVVRRLGWAGKPYPHVETALADPATGELLDGPAEGELLVRGPNVFIGYHGRPDATAQTMIGDWLRTGDIAERDADGYYRLRGRLKDMYVSGGENVYPAEVESVLDDHPDIVEAAVIGVPDARWGEVGYAVVTPREGSGLDERAVRAHCRRSLASFKVPAHVSFVTALPRSAIGKLDKLTLRTMCDPGEGVGSSRSAGSRSERLEDAGS